MKIINKNHSNFSERIAKKIARSGICSRREAERLIINGKVTLNNKILIKTNINVSKKDVILVNGKTLPKVKKVRLWLFYKEKGYLVTNYDQFGRPTIFEKLRLKIKNRLIAVGRLDMNSEGLLLLTNNGELARKLELPNNGYVRTYRVRVHGLVSETKLLSLEKGICINKIRYKSITAKLDRQQKTNAWITISFKEGKNREIRKIMDYFGYSVNRLIRISYGPFNLDALKAGELIEVNQNKINQLLKLS